MAVERIIVLSLLVAQALSAPSGCTESCTSYHSSYRSQSAGGYQDHADLAQAASNLGNLEYARPGNWTEHNQYRTDGGNGRVIEERGQYVEGPRRVRFFKKNYTSSYSTGGGAGLSELEQQNSNQRYGTVYTPTSQQIIDSQRAYSQYGGSGSASQQHEYNRQQSHHEHSSTSTNTNTNTNSNSNSNSNSHSQRLEDFGEYSGNSQVTQHGATDYNAVRPNGHPDNWRRVDSYKTDGGNGRVFEEEGQFVNGPKKVRYYKRNYTSSYSSGGTPVEIGTIGTGVHDIHREIEKLHREIGRELEHVEHSSGHASSSNVRETGSSMGIGGTHSATTDRFGHQAGSVSTSSVQRNTEQHSVDSHGIIQQLPYTVPTQNVYGTNSYNTYEKHEGYVSNAQPTTHYVVPTASYTQGHSDRHDGYSQTTLNRDMEQHVSDAHREAEILTRQNQYHDNVRQNMNQNTARYPSDQVGHYKEHWSSSSHTREGNVPHLNTDSLRVDHQNAQYSRNSYGEQQGGYRGVLGTNSQVNQFRENNFNSAYRTTSGQLATGSSLDLGHAGHSVDCTHDTEHTQQESRYHRLYKRGAKYHELEDLQQHQSEDFTQQAQHDDDLNQHTGGFDDTQQTMGKLEFGQQREDDHPTQQSMDNLELGQYAQHPFDKPAGGQHLDDLTQQTTGKLEFGQGQQTYRPRRPMNSQRLEDLTQQSEDLTQQSEDLTQQSEDLTQQSEDLTNQSQLGDLSQQTVGTLEFGQQRDHTRQTIGRLEFGQQQQHQPGKPSDQHFGGLSQENEDLTQQMGKLEFGQHTQYPYPSQRPTGNQHSEDLTQQTSGKLEFGQQTQYPYPSQRPTVNQHSEDLTQQTSGKLELGQQMQYPYPSQRPMDSQSEDITHHGKPEFGQQGHQSWESGNQNSGGLTQHDKDVMQLMAEFEFSRSPQTQYRPARPNSGSQHLDLSQQSEDLTQQTGGFDDFAGPESGKLEFGQQTQQTFKPWKPSTANQHMEDLTGQNEDLRDQTGKMKYEYQGAHQVHPKPSVTSNFDDLTQKATADLELGHEMRAPYKPWEPSNYHDIDLSQQNEDLTQQTGKISFGQDDLTQQTMQGRGDNLYQQSNIHQWDQDMHEAKPWLREELTQHYVQHPFNPVPPKHQQEHFGSGVDSDENPSGVLPLDQEGSANNQLPQQPVPKPAQKPRPRPRYTRPASRPTQDKEESQSTPQTQEQRVSHWSEEHSNGNKPGSPQVEDQRTVHSGNEDISLAIHPPRPDVNKEAKTDDARSQDIRGDQENSNGLQWHYTYHPSDLTNSEPQQSSFYPNSNYNPSTQQRETIGQTVQQSHDDRDDDSQKPSNVFGSTAQEMQQGERFSNMQHSTPGQQPQWHSNNFDQQIGSYEQSQGFGQQHQSQINKGDEEMHGKLEFGQQAHHEDQVQQMQQNGIKIHKLEPRILEAYGGGPYDAGHNDDIFSRVPPNPSVTLPPIDAADPWDIREKPRERPRGMGTTSIDDVELTIAPIDPTDTTTDMTTDPVPPTFWGRIGNKLTNTFDKAKEKAINIFG